MLDADDSDDLESGSDDDSSQPSILLKLKIKTMTNKEFVVEATTRETVGHLKEIIEVTQGFPTAQQRLIWRDKAV